MEIHDQYVNDLFESKSLEALIYLIDAGRELEFTYYGKDYFISKSNSKQYVSLQYDGVEQSFNSVRELIGNSTLHDVPFCSAWCDVELKYLF